MSNKPGEGGGHPPLSAKVADQLLELLSSDDAFRSSFQQDPGAALAQLGYEPVSTSAIATGLPAEGELLYCMTAATLAPKEEIAQARNQLQSFLTSQTDHRVVFAFEAGKIDSVLRNK